jgi:hypothetical protein
LLPSRGSRPCAAFHRDFQSNATFRAFSTASAPPLDEEQVGERRIAEHARERLDEARHRGGVDVGVARLVERRHEQLLAKDRVIGEGRVVHPQRAAGKEGEQVEVCRPGALVHECRASARGEVEDQIETVDEQVTAQDVVHRRGRYGKPGQRDRRHVGMLAGGSPVV